MAEEVMEENTEKRVNFETRMEVLRGGNVDYGRYPAVSLRTYQQAVVYRQDWTSTSFASYLRQQILAYADTVHGIL